MTPPLLNYYPRDSSNLQRKVLKKFAEYLGGLVTRPGPGALLSGALHLDQAAIGGAIGGVCVYIYIDTDETDRER